MKQIIPFKKELLFKTKVSEITSISLEHTLNLKSDDLISGQFHITGDYKMTEGSINRENFNFDLPFDIALDARYDMSSIVIDIDNFYYEIINSEALQVNIDVYVEGDKKEEPEPTIIEEEPTIIEEPLTPPIPAEEVFFNPEEIKEERNAPQVEIEEEYEPSIELNKPQKVIIEPKTEIINQDQTDTNQNITINNEFNIFENLDNADTYVTYYVYIVKEEDTIDKILEKYNVTKEELANYNTLENITPGTKLIIPSQINE